MLHRSDFYEKAERLFHSNQFLQAIEFIEKNIDCEKKFKTDTYVLKGLCFEGLYKHNEAIQNYDKAIELKNVAAYNFKGWLIKNKYESNKLFKDALQLNENTILAQDYFNKGKTNRYIDLKSLHTYSNNFFFYLITKVSACLD